MKRLAEILALLAKPSELDDQQISDLRTELRTIYSDVRAETVTPETVATAQSIREAIGTINAVETERAEALAALEAQLADIDADVLDPEPEAEADPETTPEGEVEGEADGGGEAEAQPPAEADPSSEPESAAAEEPVAVAAGATPTPLEQVASRTPVRARPRPTAPARRSRTFAAGNVRGMTAGDDFTDVGQLSQALIDTWEANANVSGGDGVKVYVARSQMDYPEERRLRSGASHYDNAFLIEAALDSVLAQGMTAAGGIQAPSTPYYDQVMLSHSSRPVRDALVNFNADRGGINWITPPKLSDVVTSGGSAAIGQVTAAQDLANATKTHQTVAAGSPQNDTIYAVTDILEFGNLMQRTFPELVKAWVGLAEAAWARFAENLLLTQIGAHSTAVTTQQRLGAARDFLNYANIAAVAYRNRHRMVPDTPLVALIPDFVVAMFQNDLASAWGTDLDGLSVARAEITGWFSQRGVRAVFFEDGVNINNNPNSGAQIFPAQTTGILQGWPTEVQWYLFHEGAHLFLDGGTLDLGIVRDSTLNAANKYQMFMESFENTVMVGIESLRIRSTICVNGATSGTVAPTTICTGGS